MFNYTREDNKFIIEDLSREDIPWSSYYLFGKDEKSSDNLEKDLEKILFLANALRRRVEVTIDQDTYPISNHVKITFVLEDKS